MKPIALSFLLFTIFSIGLSLKTVAQCEIGDIEATPTECDSMGYFDIIINFDYANTGSQGFTIQGSGMVYGTFEYEDLPVIIYDLLGDGTTFYEFVVRDIEFPDCSNFIEFGIVDCFGGECAIWNVDVFPQPCENGYFYVDLGFWYENVGSMGFHVQGNGNNYGDFEYGNLPITIGPLEGDGITEYEFVVIDNEFEGCSDWAAIDPIECDSTGGDCHIWDLVIDDHPCNNGMFNVYLDFEYEYVGDTGFALYVNYDLFGNYYYEDLPLESIGPFNGDGSTVYHFLVTDLMDEACAEDANFGPIECDSIGECEIGEIDVTILPCNDDNEFYVLLDFDYANTSEGFTVQGSGMMYGSFLYSNLPVEIGPLQGDGISIYEFAVIDAVYNDCAEDTHIEPVSCDSLTEFKNFSTEVVSCINVMYELQLDFDVYQGGTDGFKIIGNGIDYGSFSYDQLPLTIGPFSTDGITSYHFIAKDIENPLYGNWDKLIPFSCESLGIKEKVIDDIIKVYPNPSYGSLVFENLNGQTVTVYLYNSTGALAATFELTDTYQLTDLYSGIYYYKIVGFEKVLAGGKVIVNK